MVFLDETGKRWKRIKASAAGTIVLGTTAFLLLVGGTLFYRPAWSGLTFPQPKTAARPSLPPQTDIDQGVAAAGLPQTSHPARPGTAVATTGSRTASQIITASAPAPATTPSPAGASSSSSTSGTSTPAPTDTTSSTTTATCPGKSGTAPRSANSNKPVSC